LTGGLVVLGTYHATISGFTGGLGWNAIAVALIARLHPLAAIASALVFSYLEAGAKASVLHTTFTFELGTIIQAVIFLFVTASIVIRFRGRR
jgi:simple sugar transport system permease protein